MDAPHTISLGQHTFSANLKINCTHQPENRAIRPATQSNVQRASLFVNLRFTSSAGTSQPHHLGSNETLCPSTITMSSLIHNPWSHLGVARHASPAQIKQARKALALASHPDKCPDASQLEKWTARMTTINLAFELASEPNKWAVYRTKHNLDVIPEPDKWAVYRTKHDSLDVIPEADIVLNDKSNDSNRTFAGWQRARTARTRANRPAKRRATGSTT